jgi:hypothetical protein
MQKPAVVVQWPQLCLMSSLGITLSMYLGLTLVSSGLQVSFCSSFYGGGLSRMDKNYKFWMKVDVGG